MPKPDVQMVHEEAGKVFYGGRIYVLTRMANGWMLTRPMTVGQLYTGGSVEDCCAWLMAQATA
jgi:hypothetical protein